MGSVSTLPADVEVTVDVIDVSADELMDVSAVPPVAVDGLSPPQPLSSSRATSSGPAQRRIVAPPGRGRRAFE
jgi:hypothetical protein